MLRVLLVEDSPGDAGLLAEALREGGLDPACERVETADAMKAALQRETWDVILSDHSLPQFTAPQALATLRAHGRDVPFIVVSGRIGEEAAVELMRGGARDYIMKGNLARLAPAIIRELHEAEERQK